MKLPNGFGSVYKFSGKRRRPWAARKTVGWTESTEGKRSNPIYKFIGYYATRAEALTALTEYNKNPYDIDAASVTFSEVYEKWSDRKFQDVSDSNIKGHSDEKGPPLHRELPRHRVGVRLQCADIGDGRPGNHPAHQECHCTVGHYRRRCG